MMESIATRSGSSSSGILIWKREDVSICECSSKPYKHVHCPCESCNGKAVRIITEYRHWKAASELSVNIEPASTSNVDRHCTLH